MLSIGYRSRTVTSYLPATWCVPAPTLMNIRQLGGSTDDTFQFGTDQLVSMYDEFPSGKESS